MEPDIQAAREAVIRARAAFDAVRAAEGRKQYDARFKDLMTALAHFDQLRSKHIERLGLGVM